MIRCEYNEIQSNSLKIILDTAGLTLSESVLTPKMTPNWITIESDLTSATGATIWPWLQRKARVKSTEERFDFKMFLVKWRNCIFSIYTWYKMVKSDWLLLRGWRFWLKFLIRASLQKKKPRCKDRRWLRKLWLTAVQYLTLIKPVYQYLARFFSSCLISFTSFCKQISPLQTSFCP